MTTVAWFLLAFITGIAAAGIIAGIIEWRKEGDPTTTAWIKIRPVLSEVFVEAVKIYQADKVGYDALEDYCVDYVKNKVEDADFLFDEEKEVLTAEFIRGLVAPQLQKLWDKKMLSQIEE